METQVATENKVKDMMRAEVENYSTTILLDFILKLMGINHEFQFALHSDIAVEISDEVKETGKLIGEIVDYQDEKVLLIDSKPVDVYQMLQISHREGYDHTWLTDENKELLCFGSKITFDTLEILDDPENYSALVTDVIKHSKNTYDLFLEIKKFYKTLRREQHRSKR